MASYPTSIKTFTTKNSGDTIQAAHVNDLQDEITAIETGLLNGLQHVLAIATGGLTVSTGNVTLGQNLQVNGESSFSGSVTLPRIPSVRLTNSVTSRVASSQTWVGLDWDTEVHDSTALHSLVSNSSRINLTSSGVWTIGYNGAAAGNVFLDVEARIMLNDASAIAGNMSLPITSDVYPVQVIGSYLATSTTDYVTVQVQSHKSTGALQAHSTTHAVTFWAQKVSR